MHTESETGQSFFGENQGQGRTTDFPDDADKKRGVAVSVESMDQGLTSLHPVDSGSAGLGSAPVGKAEG